MINLETIRLFNQKLIDKGLTIFCAESITAGLLASTIASVSGASALLKGSIVTYDERVKTALLGVPEEILAKHSAESQETTSAMCEGIRKLYPGVSIYVAVVGVASQPAADSGYEVIREVGQIYVSVWYGKLHEFATIIKPGNGSDQRNEIREKTVEFIFEKILGLVG